MRTPTSLYDADNHYYEARDCFTRHMEPRFRDGAIHVVRDESGRDRVMIGDQPFTFLENSYTQTVHKPGALREMLRNLRYGDSEGSDTLEALRPEYVDREVRLRVMDEQGLEAILLFPTLAVCVEQSINRDVDQCYANLRAFNRWLDEDWGFAWQGRIFGVPLLSLLEAGSRHRGTRVGHGAGRARRPPASRARLRTRAWRPLLRPLLGTHQ